MSNGSYLVLITANGTGFSSYGGDVITNWTGDRIEDCEGFFLYLRDRTSGAVWSMGRRPLTPPPGKYEAAWRHGTFSIVREDHGIEMRLDACVAPDLPVEIRRVHLTNRSDRPREIEITSYAEVVLLDRLAHLSHPAFSKLFVQTEFDAVEEMLIARRRPRGSDESHPCAFHAAIGGTPTRPAVPEFETDRTRFIGRCRDARRPVALETGEPLSRTTGHVLDPILSLRRSVELMPGEEATMTFLLGAAANRSEAAESVRTIRSNAWVESSFSRAAAIERERSARSGLDEDSAAYCQNLAAAVLRGEPALRAAPEVLGRASGCASDLASFELARGRWVTVLHAEAAPGERMIDDAMRVHRYWRELGLPIDLLILCGDEARGESPRFIRRSQLTPERIDALDAAAHLVLTTHFPAIAGGRSPIGA